MASGTGAVPAVHGLMPSDVAVFPGVIVIVQELAGAKIAPHVVLVEVPEGKEGALTATLPAGELPVFVTVITLGSPELGVPLNPYSV